MFRFYNLPPINKQVFCRDCQHYNFDNEYKYPDRCHGITKLNCITGEQSYIEIACILQNSNCECEYYKKKEK